MSSSKKYCRVLYTETKKGGGSLEFKRNPDT